MNGLVRTVYRAGSGEITEKKSRFIASAVPVKTEEEALEFIASVRKKYWDARHNCYAYIIGEHGETMRSSDDGEPSGTAGKPILEILLAENLTDTAVVVTRYFGGILLGTGGLVRAYSSAAHEALSASVIIEKKHGIRCLIRTNYTDLGKVQYHLAQNGIPVLETNYTDDVSFEVIMPDEKKKQVLSVLTEATAGRTDITETEELWFGEHDGEVCIWD